MTRRTFLSASGVALGAGPLAVSSARALDAPSSPLCIDCQSHLFCPEVVDLLEKRSVDSLVYRRGGDRIVRMGDWHRKILPKHMDVAAKLADMDNNGIDRTALSVNDPGPEWFGKEGPAVARLMNNFVAGIVRQHPSRFLGLCILPLQDMAVALTELKRCVGELGMKGMLLDTNLVGGSPTSRSFARCSRGPSN